MAAPSSMSQFLGQPAADFIAKKNDAALTERLVSVFTRADITDVGTLVVKTEEALIENGCGAEDLAQLKEHLGWYDVRLAPSNKTLARAFV